MVGLILSHLPLTTIMHHSMTSLLCHSVLSKNDSELDYIPTQFICEYIRYIKGADGILFDSSLHLTGKNIVLFEQDKVECVSVKKYIVTKVEIDYIVEAQRQYSAALNSHKIADRLLQQAIELVG